MLNTFSVLILVGDGVYDFSKASIMSLRHKAECLFSQLENLKKIKYKNSENCLFFF